MLFEKWYLDIQNADSTGYFYAGRLVIGGISIPFSEIHLFQENDTTHEYRLGLKFKKTFRSVTAGHYSIRLNKDFISLEIRYNDGVIKGNWKQLHEPLSQPVKPVFQNENGICSWRVWAPQSEVNITGDGNPIFEMTGLGYIDHVHLSIPFWKVPFQTLCWGRLFSEDSWVCFFHLSTPGSQMGFMAGESGWNQNVSVKIIKDTEGNVKKFSWLTNTENLICEVTECLHKGPVLDFKRTGWLPSAWRDRISCSAFEKKYKVRSYINQKSYSGIMEEVNWNGTRNHLFVQ